MEAKEPRPLFRRFTLRMMNAIENGKKTREVSALNQVSPIFVSNIHKCCRQTGAFTVSQLTISEELCWSRCKNAAPDGHWQQALISNAGLRAD